MAKYRVEVAPGAEGVSSLAGIGGGTNLKVLATKDGSVNLGDKLKGYYHTLIAITSGILLTLNTFTDAFGFIPSQYKGITDAVIVTVGIAVTFLKNNEQWVDSL